MLPSPVRGSPGSLAACLLSVAARQKAKIYSALKVLMNMQTVRPEILLILVTGYARSSYLHFSLRMYTT